MSPFETKPHHDIALDVCDDLSGYRMGEGIRFDVVDAIHGILRGSLCVAFLIEVQRDDVVDLLS